MRTVRSNFTCCALAIILISGTGQAKMMMPLAVPVARLITNVTAYVAKHPQYAQGYFTLGRLHAVVFARGEVPVGVYGYSGDAQNAEPSLPNFAYGSHT